MLVPNFRVILGPIARVRDAGARCPVCGKATSPDDFNLRGERFHYECAAFRGPAEPRRPQRGLRPARDGFPASGGSRPETIFTTAGAARGRERLSPTPSPTRRLELEAGLQAKEQ
jgi:hypothetical protein